jgi:hypothetical protein
MSYGHKSRWQHEKSTYKLDEQQADTGSGGEMPVCGRTS